MFVFTAPPPPPCASAGLGPVAAAAASDPAAVCSSSSRRLTLACAGISPSLILLSPRQGPLLDFRRFGSSTRTRSGIRAAFHRHRLPALQPARRQDRRVDAGHRPFARQYQR